MESASLSCLDEPGRGEQANDEAADLVLLSVGDGVGERGADDVRFLGHPVVLDEILERHRRGLAHLRLGGVAGQDLRRRMEKPGCVEPDLRKVSACSRIAWSGLGTAPGRRSAARAARRRPSRCLTRSGGRSGASAVADREVRCRTRERERARGLRSSDSDSRSRAVSARREARREVRSGVRPGADRCFPSSAQWSLFRLSPWLAEEKKSGRFDG